MAHQIHSIAFPAISCGVYRYPLEQAAQVAVSSVREWVKGHPDLLDTVYFVAFDQTMERIYQQQLAQD